MKDARFGQRLSAPFFLSGFVDRELTLDLQRIWSRVEEGPRRQWGSEAARRIGRICGWNLFGKKMMAPLEVAKHELGEKTE
jgi:hypothetical protein